MNQFALLAAYAPHDPIAVGEDGVRSATDLLRDVAAVAARLPAGPAELLISCHDRYLLAVSLLAAWQRGCVVALPPNAREQTLSELLPHCALALHDGGGLGVDVRSWLPSAADPGAEGLAPIPADRPLVTIYTSGSTGAAIGCRKLASQLLGEARTLQDTFRLTRESCVLATVPGHHIYGLLFGVTLPLAAGARFVRETPLHTPVIEELARRHDASDLVSVPAHLHALAGAQLEALAGVRRVFSSGAPLPDTTARELHRRFSLVVREVLGSTETGGFAWREAEQPEARFRPFAGVSVSAGADDQLLLRSPLLDPAIAQPLACPDRIAQHPDGSFRHLGRLDGVVKIGGTRVALSELEARVRGLPGVRDAALLAVDAAQTRGQELWLVVASEGARELPELRAELLRYYEPVVLPRRVRFVEALPREATGKLPRARLLQLFDAAKPENSPALAQHSAAALAIQARREFAADGGGSGLGFSAQLPADLPHFAGHFPDQPLLPAIAQIELLLLDEVERRWPELPPLRELSRMKWKAPLYPGDAVAVELVLRADARVDFVIRRDSQLCAQGSLLFGAEPA